MRRAVLGVPDCGDVSTCRLVSSGMTVGGLLLILSPFGPDVLARGARTWRGEERCGRGPERCGGCLGRRRRVGGVRCGLEAFEGAWEILATPKMPRGLAGRSTVPGRARRCSPRPCTPIDATAALDVIWMPGGLRRRAAWSKPLSGSGRSDCLPRLRIEDELPQLRFGVG